MKRFTVLIALLSALLPLSAASYFSSNALGQNLGAIDGLTGTGYEGETDGGRTVIYNDGKIISKRTVSDNSSTLVEDGYSESIVYDNDGRRVSLTVEDGGRTTKSVYSYDGERLSSVVITDGEGIERIIEYIDTPEGRLMGLSGDESGYILPSYYVYTASDGTVSVSLHTSDETASSEFAPDPSVYSVDEDGNWTGTTMEDGVSVTRVYSPDGLLLSLSGDGRTESYEYDDDGLMISSDVTEGEQRTVTMYEDGRTVSETIYDDGVISRERRYNDDGSVEEIRYSDGKMKTRILFDSDGLRIRSVENF